MSDTITVTGLVATEPKHIVTTEGLSITSFRLESALRRFDRAKEKWIDVDTNWYTVSSFRQLASNVSLSVVKGERVVVTGRVRIREWQGTERSGTNVDIEADAIGHDLSWGTSTFSRTISSSHAMSVGSAEAEESHVQSTEAAEIASTPEPALPF